MNLDCDGIWSVMVVACSFATFGGSLPPGCTIDSYTLYTDTETGKNYGICNVLTVSNGVSSHTAKMFLLLPTNS